jgi:tetratricopeptide (TPR) repeat protein
MYNAYLSSTPPHHNPEIATLVDQATQALLALPDTTEATSPPETAVHVADRLGVSAENCNALYAAARKLCDDGEFRHALPLALVLSAYKGQDARYSFLAGTCMQRLALFPTAAAMYGLSLLADPESARTVFRLGECFEAQKEFEQAEEAFETAIDLCRGKPECRQIQDFVSLRLSSLRRRI